MTPSSSGKTASDLEPILPMEPQRVEKVPVGSDWIAQVKWDGVRILSYAEGENIQLFNRKKRKRTFHYPEVLEALRRVTADSYILDGEMVALGADGKPAFHEIMHRDGIRRLDRVAVVKRTVPVYYMVFDVLYHNGKWITDLPLDHRMDLLQTIVPTGDTIQLVTSQADTEALFEVTRLHGLEGVVVKRRDSGYTLGQKTNAWVKVKHYQDLNAVIGGYTLDDAGVVNAVLLGAYEEKGSNTLRYIGHAGTGRLTHAEWRALTQRLKPLQTAERPFVNRPDRHADAYWVRPEIVAKIQFLEWTPAKSLRQPTIQAILPVSPDSCVLTDW